MLFHFFCAYFHEAAVSSYMRDWPCSLTLALILSFSLGTSALAADEVPAPTPVPGPAPAPELAPAPGSASVPAQTAAPAKPDPYAVKSLKKTDLDACRCYTPDGKRFAMSKLDEKGIYQVYVGKAGEKELTCITAKQQEGGPKPERHKMQVQWHPNGKWIFMAVERDQYKTPPILGANKDFVEGELQCGLWTNMYAVTPDGKRWVRLTDFKSDTPGTPDGFTGPAISPNGKKAVWSQIVDGNVFAYWPFGKWELIEADIEEQNGLPKLTHLKNITPKGMHWNEPGNFAPDNESVLLSGSVEKDQQGMDQYILNIRTGKLTNLTNSPTVWDEHGVFSPDGQKIVFMSAYPYRDDPSASKVLSIRTEFVLMNRDGSGLTTLTHFRDPNHPQYTGTGGGIAACGIWALDGHSLVLSTLIFPKYACFKLEFQGPWPNAAAEAKTPPQTLEASK